MNATGYPTDGNPEAPKHPLGAELMTCPPSASRWLDDWHRAYVERPPVRDPMHRYGAGGLRKAADARRWERRTA